MRSVIWFLAIGCYAVAGSDNGFINFGLFVCPREEKALGRCLRDIINSFIPFIATGMPNIGIPTCEPLRVPSMSLQQTAGPISVVSSYTNVTIRGSSATHVEELIFNRKNNKVIGKIYIPQLRMKGDYKLSGNIMTMPIHGEGKFSGLYDDIHGSVIIKLGRARRSNGDEALVCEDLDVKFDIEHASIEFEDLISGDHNDVAINRYINEYWDKLAEDLKTPMEKKLHDFLKPIIDYAFALLNPKDLISL